MTDIGQWVPAGERYRVTYGYQARLLNVHKSVAIVYGTLRGLVSALSWDLIAPVPRTFVEILDRARGQR